MFATRRHFLVAILISATIDQLLASDDELRMVHVIFRHGQRAPSNRFADGMYPKDPYANKTYFPEGHSGLTNNGKLEMYELGVHLRQRYDRFLGDLYTPDITRLRSTATPRAIMSAQLVNAGLWPPTKIQQWNPRLLWQPVYLGFGWTLILTGEMMYNLFLAMRVWTVLRGIELDSSNLESVPKESDSLMLAYNCPAYAKEYERILNTDEVREIVDSHRQFFDYMSEHAGNRMKTPYDVFFIYHILSAELNYNLTLPEWTRSYFPWGEMYDVTMLQYQLSNWNTLMKKLNGGPLLREIIKNYELHVQKDGEMGRRKLTLYSGHEFNICNVLQGLGLWQSHVPRYGSAVIFELHENTTTHEFGIQVLYRTGNGTEIVPLLIPDCERICPMQKFIRLLSGVIPEDVDELCGLKANSHDKMDQDEKSAANIFTLPGSVYCFSLAFLQLSCLLIFKY